VYKHLLVPTDGSPLSLKAARTAAALAAKLGARITAINVIAPFIPPVYNDSAIAYPQYFTAAEYEAAMRKVAARATAKVAAAAGRVKCDQLAIVGADAWEAIVKAARSRKCDLIVMASHGRRGIAGFLLGSETQKVLTHSKVPVLVCR
jgi:nucleotide-binding universal stress UspA family protein